MSTTEQDFLYDERSTGVWYPPPWRIPNNATSPALASNIVVSIGNARLYGFTATSTNVAAQFILVFDDLAVPSNGKVPLFAFNVAAGAPVAGYWGSMGRTFDRGIIITNSTTQGSLTLGAADTIFDVQYV